jgi:hypothetical protein
MAANTSGQTLTSFKLLLQHLLVGGGGADGGKPQYPVRRARPASFAKIWPFVTSHLQFRDMNKHSHQHASTRWYDDRSHYNNNNNNNNNNNEPKIQQFMYSNTTNVEHEMYDYTGNNLSQRNFNKKFKENLEAMPGKHSIDSLEKRAILGTSHIIRKVRQSETWSLSGGDHRWFKRRSTREKKPVARENKITIIIIIIIALFPVHAMKAQRQSGCIAPLILNLGTRWRLVVNIRPRPLCSREN